MLTAHIHGTDATTAIVVLHAVMETSPTRGDQLEACVPPEPGWLSERDGDVAAGKDEDRLWRQYP